MSLIASSGSYRFGVDNDEHKPKHNQGSKQKPRKQDAPKPSRPTVRDAGVRSSQRRTIAHKRRSISDPCQEVVVRETNNRRAGNSKGKFTSAQKHKLRAVVQLNKGVSQQTVANKYMWICRDANLKGSDVTLTNDTLGVGISGEVRLAKIRSSGQYCACKCIEKSRMTREKAAERLRMERQALQHCNSPFVVKLFGTYQVGTVLLRMRTFM